MNCALSVPAPAPKSHAIGSVSERVLGAPKAVGDHRHRVVELDHLQDAAAALDLGIVDDLELAAENRTGETAA